MASTVGARYVASGIDATGANIDIRSVGFKPLKVEVYNKTTQYRLQWNYTMADAAGIKVSDTGTSTNITSSGITPLNGDSTNPPGFRIGALADVNDAAGEELLWEAWG